MIYSLGERRADIAADCYVAPSAQLVGSVRLARESSVWFNVVIRGDCDWIEIGPGSNVQDGTVIHTDAGVTIGHMAFLHSCSIGDGSMIANGAMVLDRVQVGRQCLIAAGALLTPDKVIPDRSVVMGSPGKVVREVTERDLAMLARAAENYRLRTQQYRSQLQPDPRWQSAGAGTR
jgi:carbonic anhydrase/acetyltransferase-like protein (isoleucine patch superfamily)